MAASDFRINSAVRSVLARHWIDTQRIKFGCFRGTVRFNGSLVFLGARAISGADASKVELVEREVKRIKEVSRVYFDLKNWKKEPGGEWTCLESQATSHSDVVDEREKQDDALLAIGTEDTANASAGEASP